MQHINGESDFWSLVEVKSPDECWIWKNGLNRDGYGRMKWNCRIVLAHRVSWIIHFGDIPSKMCVCHKCDNPSCVNPNHLFLGTTQDNTKDRHLKHRDAMCEHHGRAKINNSDAIKIRELRGLGFTVVKLGEMFNLDHTMISRICRNKNWNLL